jgi:hypothetical protein
MIKTNLTLAGAVTRIMSVSACSSSIDIEMIFVKGEYPKK